MRSGPDEPRRRRCASTTRSRRSRRSPRGAGVRLSAPASLGALAAAAAAPVVRGAAPAHRSLPRPGRGVAATRLRGIATFQPRRRRDSPPRNILRPCRGVAATRLRGIFYVPAGASPRLASAEYSTSLPRRRRDSSPRSSDVPVAASSRLVSAEYSRHTAAASPRLVSRITEDATVGRRRPGRRRTTRTRRRRRSERCPCSRRSTSSARTTSRPVW